MAHETYTLILTRGTHVVSGVDAQRIARALARRTALLEVGLDPFGAVDAGRRTTLALGHVVALTKNPPEATLDRDAGTSPVASLAARRGAAARGQESRCARRS